MGIKSYLKNKLVKVKKEKLLVPCLEGHFLEGRCALITGGTSGIGLAIAESFLKNGSNVIICARTTERLENAKKKLIEVCNCDSSRIDILEIDISKVDEAKEKFLHFSNGFDKNIDIFVNNAGVNGGKVFPNTNEKDYDTILDTNLKGVYFFSQEIAQYMIRKSIKGNILNIVSSSALRPAISPYIIAKWGERGLTLGMAKKYLPYGIIVNGLAPGSTLTPMLSKDIDDNMHLDYSPSKRYAAPEEIANLATILVSDLGKMIVGDIIYATGGAGVLTYDDMSY